MKRYKVFQNNVFYPVGYVECDSIDEAIRIGRESISKEINGSQMCSEKERYLVGIPVYDRNGARRK